MMLCDTSKTYFYYARSAQDLFGIENRLSVTSVECYTILNHVVSYVILDKLTFLLIKVN